MTTTELALDKRTEIKGDLAQVVTVYSKALSWLVDLVVHEKNRTRSMPFEISRMEIQHLGIPIESILRDINTHSRAGKSLPAPCDFWSEAISRYAYRDKSQDLYFAVPQYLPADFRVVERLLIKPTAESIPFMDIVEAIRGHATLLGVDSKNYLFYFDDYAIDSGVWFYCLLRMGIQPLDEVCQLIRCWRDDRLDSLREGALDWAEDDEDEPSEPPAPPEEEFDIGDSEFRDPTTMLSTLKDAAKLGNPNMLVRGEKVYVSRQLLANLLSRHARTIYRWDDLGRVPTGRKWVAPALHDNKRAFYDIMDNWHAICSLLQRPRDEGRDEMARMEIHAGKDFGEG